MHQTTVYAGLDYHHKFIQVCLLDDQGKVLRNVRAENDWAEVAATLPEGVRRVQAAIEACAGAASLADELVERAGWSVDLAHPGYVARMKQGPDKTDFSDARVLADLERVGYVPRVWHAPEQIRELRRLVHHRFALVDQRRALKLRISAALRDQRILNAPALPWTKRWLQWLREEAPLSEQSRWIIGRQLRQLSLVFEEISLVEERLELVTGNDVLVARLRQEKGVGLVTACVLRALIGRFDRFRSGRQLSKFCGLSPRNVSSGSRQSTAGLIHSCDRQLRSTLIETAHRLKRFVPRWQTLAASMLERGKPRCVIVAAVANRWVRQLWHDMKPLRLNGEAA